MMNLESLSVGTSMRRLGDIAVFSKSKDLVLVVQIDGSAGSSSESAAYFRRAMIEERFVENAPFLLIASKTTIFLWRRDTPLDEEPDFTAPIKPVLQFYWRSHYVEHYGREVIELLMHTWLGDLAIGIREPDTAFAADEMLLDSGLYKLMQSGYVRFDVSE